MSINVYTGVVQSDPSHYCGGYGTGRGPAAAHRVHRLRGAPDRTGPRATHSTDKEHP